MIAILDDSDVQELIKGLYHYRKWAIEDFNRTQKLSIEKDVYGWANYMTGRQLARIGRIMLQLGMDPED